MMENKVQMAFAAIDKQIEKSIPSYEQSETRGKNYIQWGENNQFPEYLNGLYEEVVTLRTIVNGTADFVSGNDSYCNLEGFGKEINKKGDTMFELVNLLGRDYLLYGNAYVQIVRNKAGKIGELYYINARYIRSSKKNDIFYYSEEYGKKYARTNKTVIYPKFIPEATNVPTSILSLKTELDKTYGLPRYIAALKDCETERQLSEFNLSQIENGFYGSYIFNFGNGIPSDEQKEEIERDINEKFCGSGNVGRFLLNFSNGKDNGVTLSKIEIQNIAEKFNLTADRARNQIYASFAAQPVLFGIQKETAGFSDEDYQQAFKLFNRTVVRPIQKKIAIMMDKIFGVENSITIEPFTIDWSEDSQDDNNEVKTTE